ncbi:MAG: hypothetical protein FJX74_06975 [Armatimonadetes bacterium]|nr:hypothetical protein [Armatimonadota bacterium]
MATWQALTIVLLALGSCAAAGPVRASLYVAVDGNDAWSGRLSRPNRARTDGPFASLTRARDEVRKLKSEPQPGGVCVEIAGGAYPLAAPLEFTTEDSGTPERAIEYRAAEGAEVRLIGGRPVADWSRVADPAIMRRLAPAARGKVFQADLRAVGVTDLQGINSPGSYRSDPGLELFFRDTPMTLARYPNEGYLRIADVLDDQGAVIQAPDAKSASGRFVCTDPRPERWAGERDVWLHGFWVWDWADLRVPLGGVDATRGVISLASGVQVRRGQWFYAENVLPELDRPGEWYLDRETSRLYFWPPTRLSAGQVVVSTVRDPVRLTDVSHITFRGLTVEAGRGHAFVITGGSGVGVIGCTIRNMGNWAVQVRGGTGHRVIGCDIYGTGQGGIYLEGGDRKTLTRGDHVAENNHIHHTSRWDPVYQQAIALRGVGNSATHNLIDNVPHIAIGFADNDMTIEYNEIHSSVYQSNDAGAIYTSPPDETWSMRGHKIRHNFLHNIHGFEGRGCHGVYLDDCFSSADISGNVFYDVANAILIGGGRDNPITNNLFLNCRQAFSIDARGLGWASSVGGFATQELLDLNYKQPPWSVRYPELTGILEDEPLAPKGNSVARNICWGGKWGWMEAKAEPLVKLEGNLIDAERTPAGQSLTDPGLWADLATLLPGFERIPFAEIGPYESPDRASWPVTSELRRDPLPPAARPKPVRKPGPPPTFDIPRLPSAVTVDGRLAAEEWFGLKPAKGLVLQEGVEGGKCGLRTRAWLAWDNEALYVAFDNAVDPNLPLGLEAVWGGNDAVEVALSNPTLGPKPPIVVLRGFACGAFSSSEEAGAPSEVARRAGENVQYAATVVSPARWTAEMRLPFASLGLDPNADLRVPLNLAVRKQGDEPWVMWRGTGGCTWLVPEAGRVRFVR